MSSTGWGAANGHAREVLARWRRTVGHGTFAALLVPLLFTSAVDASVCAAGEYQRAALAVSCDGDSGSLDFTMSGEEQGVIVATFPVGATGVRVTMLADAPTNIQVIDHESGTCIVGHSCLHSSGCVNESSHCIDELDMEFYFSGNLTLEAQTAAVSGPLTRTLDFVVLGSAASTTGSANYSYGVVQPCPEVQPACSPCSSYTGCGSTFGQPQCDGSPTVNCVTTTSGTTTPPACRADHFRTSPLYAGCDSGEGFQKLSLSGGLTLLETLPAGQDGFRVQVESADNVHIQLLDANGTCQMGTGCRHSVDCRNEGDTCLTYEGMWFFFNSSAEVLELFDNASVPIHLAVRAYGNSTASVSLSYGVSWDCVQPGPNCAPCGSYTGCGVGETPACDGGSEVVCLPPTTTTRTSSSTTTSTGTTSATTTTSSTATGTTMTTSTSTGTWSSTSSTTGTTTATTSSATTTSMTTLTNTTMTATATSTTNFTVVSLWPSTATATTTTASASLDSSDTSSINVTNATNDTTTTTTAIAAVIPRHFATDVDENATASLGALVMAMLLASLLVCCMVFLAYLFCRYCCRRNSDQSIVPMDDPEKGFVPLVEESGVQQKVEEPPLQAARMKEHQLQARPKVLVEFVRGGQRPLDLVCCVEHNSTTGEPCFAGSLAFLEAMARHLDMPPVKVGILRYGDDASTVCPMADGREELLANIAGLGYEEPSRAARRLSPTLEDAGLMLQVGGFGEPGARKRAIIIVTEGYSVNQDTEVDYQAASLKGHDVFVVVVLVGECKSPQVARSLASKPTEAFFFQVNSYDELPSTSMPVLQSVLESSLEVRKANCPEDAVQQQQVPVTQQHFPERRLEIPGVLPWEPSPVEPSPPVPRDTRRPAPALVDVLPGLGGLREDASPKLVPSGHSTPGDERSSDKPRSPPTPSTAAPSQTMDELSSMQLHCTQHHSTTGSGGLPPLSPLVSTQPHAASVLRHNRLAAEPPPTPPTTTVPATPPTTTVPATPPTTTVPAKPDNCPGDLTERRSAPQPRSARRVVLPPPPLLDPITTPSVTSPLQPLSSNNVSPEVEVDCPDSPEFLT